MEANDGFWVDAHNVQAPAVTLQELSKEPQEDSTKLLVLGKQVNAGEYQVPGDTQRPWILPSVLIHSQTQVSQKPLPPPSASPNSAS